MIIVTLFALVMNIQGGTNMSGKSDEAISRTLQYHTVAVDIAEGYRPLASHQEQCRFLETCLGQFKVDQIRPDNRNTFRAISRCRGLMFIPCNAKKICAGKPWINVLKDGQIFGRVDRSPALWFAFV